MNQVGKTCFSTYPYLSMPKYVAEPSMKCPKYKIRYNGFVKCEAGDHLK